jgi:hypothetical protein
VCWLVYLDSYEVSYHIVNYGCEHEYTYTRVGLEQKVFAPAARWARRRCILVIPQRIELILPPASSAKTKAQSSIVRVATARFLQQWTQVHHPGSQLRTIEVAVRRGGQTNAI